MKIFKTIFLVVLAASIFAACTPDLDKILIKQDGVWNVDKWTTETYTDGVLIDSLTTVETGGSYTFNEDMTGSFIDADGETGTFSWSYNADLEALTMVDDSFPFPIIFDVVEYTKNSQTLRWEFELGTDKDVTTVELSR